MEIIGYDLDGVICPDVEWNGKTDHSTIEDLHNRREKIYPIFIPSFPFVIITGRPICDKDITIKWLNKYNIVPIYIHFYTQNIWTTSEIVKHKAFWINTYSNGYHMKYFVESELKQTKELQKLCNIPIHHFSTIVNGLLK